jgi:hypothetical protein
VIGGLVSILIAQSVEVAQIVAWAIKWAASFGFLRLATLSLAQAFDLATFSVMVARHGARAEANPIVGNLFDVYGMPAVIVGKVALVLLIGALCLMAYSRGGTGLWRLVGGLPLALAISAGLIGGITNAAVLLR